MTSLDLGEGCFNHQAAPAAFLPPRPTPLSPVQIQWIHTGYIGNKIQKMQSYSVKSLLMSCYSSSLLIEPACTPLQASSSHLPAFLYGLFLYWWCDTALSVCPVPFPLPSSWAFFSFFFFGSLTLMTSATQPQCHFHTPLSYFSTLEFFLFSFFFFLLTLPSSYFISPSSSVHLQFPLPYVYKWVM